MREFIYYACNEFTHDFSNKFNRLILAQLTRVESRVKFSITRCNHHEHQPVAVSEERNNE